MPTIAFEIAAANRPRSFAPSLPVLRRGFSGDTTLFQWWHAVAEGNLDRRNVSVILLDEQRQEVARWNLRRAWPTKWAAPSLNAKGNEVAIETLELAHEGIELE